MTTITLERPQGFDATSGKAILDRYNTLAAQCGKPAVKRFSDRPTALKRLEALEAFARTLVPAPEAKPAKSERKRRQPVFSYPAAPTQKAVKLDSLRGQALALLTRGATFAKVMELCAEFDGTRGKDAYRLEPRAYGLVRLLHTWAGYGLREEIVNGVKVIYAMDAATWKAFQDAKKAARA